MKCQRILLVWACSCLCLAASPLASFAQVIISTDQTQNGGSVTIPTSEFITGGSNARLTMTNGAVRQVNGTVGVAIYEGSGGIFGSSPDKGELRVQNSSRLTSWYGLVGDGRKTQGTATVEGAGSTWEIYQNATIGLYGYGTLNIQNGGVVGNTYSWVGHGFYDTPSTGTVNVSGAGSKWQNNGFLGISGYGNGTLNIQNGGQVNNTRGYVGSYSYSGNPLNGTVTVEGAGSNWQNSDGLYLGGTETAAGGNGTINVGTGETVQVARDSKIWNNGRLNINNGGKFQMDSGNLSNLGVIDIKAGGTFQTSRNVSGGTFSNEGTVTLLNGGNMTYDFHLGNTASSNSTVNVGAFSSWQRTTDVRIGNSGTGTLNIQNGGLVTSNRAFLGYEASGHGTATVTGVGSAWQSSDDFFVGRKGTGVHNVQNGGNVTSSAGFVGYNAGSNGTATIDGAGSKWQTNLHTVTGYSGNGTVHVQNGGQLLNTRGYVGILSGSNGTLNITGTDSLWQNTNGLYVGGLETVAGGTGTVNVGTGGTVQVAGDSKIWNNGRLNINNGGNFQMDSGNLSNLGVIDIKAGGTFQTSGNVSGGTFSNEGTVTLLNGGNMTYDFHLGNTASSNSTVNVDGAGSSLQRTTDARIGNSGTGTLNIENGGLVTNSEGLVGNNSGSTGTVNVDGAGSKWQNSGRAYIGYYGNGTLNIQNGSLVTNQTGYVSYNSGSTGTVTVDGAGSKWQNTNSAYIGVFGNGTVNIQNGGSVTSPDGFVGYSSGSTGTVTVDGAGSEWQNSTGTYIVGHYGTGILDIQNGGLVTNSDGIVGYVSGSNGTVTVDGAGSAWGSLGSVRVGFLGTGTLNIMNGGQVTNQAGYVGHNSGSAGTVTVEGAGSTWQSNGLYVGGSGSGAGGTGSVAIANGGLVSVTGGGHVYAGSAINIQDGGNFHLQTGSFTNLGLVQLATGGTLINDGSFQGQITGSGGTVSGSGSYSDLAIANGMIAAPGNSPGIMTSSTTIWGDGGTYQWEIADLMTGAGIGWDLWNTMELSILSGEFTIELISLDEMFDFAALANWDASQDYSWQIASANNGAFTNTALGYLALDLTQFSSYNNINGGTFSLISGNSGNGLFLNFDAASQTAAVPEPSTICLLLCSSGGLGIFTWVRRRKTQPAMPAETLCLTT